MVACTPTTDSLGSFLAFVVKNEIIVNDINAEMSAMTNNQMTENVWAEKNRYISNHGCNEAYFRVAKIGKKSLSEMEVTTDENLRNQLAVARKEIQNLR